MNHPHQTRNGTEATIELLRNSIVDKLSGFDSATLLDQLAAAVVIDCAAERAQLPDSGSALTTLSTATVDVVGLTPTPAQASTTGQSTAIPSEPNRPTASMMASADLAKALDIPEKQNAVDLVLRRYAKQHLDCREEIPGRKKGEARYLYRVSEVWPMLLKKLPGWRGP